MIKNVNTMLKLILENLTSVTYEPLVYYW